MPCLSLARNALSPGEGMGQVYDDRCTMPRQRLTRLRAAKENNNIKGIIARAIYPGNTTAGQRQGDLVKSTGREKQSGSTAAGKKQGQAGCGWHSDEGSKRGRALPGDVNKPRPPPECVPFRRCGCDMSCGRSENGCCDWSGFSVTAAGVRDWLRLGRIWVWPLLMWRRVVSMVAMATLECIAAAQPPDNVTGLAPVLLSLEEW